MKNVMMLMLLATGFAGCASGDTAQAPSPHLGPEEGPYRVKRVLSGDLIELANGESIRYAGIIAPKPGEAFFEEARLRNDQFVVGKDVEVHLRVLEGKRDEEGRRFASVLVPAKTLDVSVLVNTSLLESGLARIDYHTVPEGFEPFFEVKEDRARRAGRGIWESTR